MTEQDKEQRTRIQRRDDKVAADATVFVARTGGDDQTRFAPPAKKIVTIPPVTPVDRTQINPDVPAHQQTGAPAAPAGRLKSRFILQDVLGAGGMGVVYKAKDSLKIEAQDSDPYVAIKVLSDEFKSHPEAFIALQRESRKTQRIAHPNIVNVHDFDRDGDTVFMTMEFLDGKPLDKLLDQYRGIGLSEEECCSILEGICSALVYAHAENIIHSDLKPGNIFVTHRGTPKVFDFGIARAVAKAERTDESTDDKTVFDAGSLGALTPAYASLEMLEGAPPDARDDIYALGCIAYELFAGEHPFKRAHADQACRDKMKVKRIPGLPKHQWRAIESCLAFRREQRMASVAEFWRQFSVRPVAKLKYVVGTLVVTTSMAVAAYQYQDELWPQFSEQEVRSEIEQALRLEMRQEVLTDLIAAGTFSAAWEATLWDTYSELRDTLGDDDPWFSVQRETIYHLYLEAVTERIGAGELNTAQNILKNAYRYSQAHEELDALSAQLRNVAERQREELQEQETARAAAEAMAVRQQQRREQQAAINRAFDAALANVDDQTACRQQLNMDDLRIAVDKLRELDRPRYQQQEARIITELASCIETVGTSFSDRAQVFKQQAQQIFPGSARIAAISISPRDPCGLSLAGMGARGQRAGCRDRAAALGAGPALVVIPAPAGGRAFAIGKEEVSVGEYNRYCELTGCTPIAGRRRDWPATDISIHDAERFLAWLSDVTGYHYRLPSASEWRHAADAGGSARDSNRNCRLDSRGIQRGDSLARVGVGQQNRWGLLNHLGNASEWARDREGRLWALGGNYQTPMEDCHLDARQAHDGRPDGATGFRVLRELNTDNGGR
ncbi:bifunctional serine/threonine-protein kinase/formylglycine-generating enzyme family protein [Marinimicrobium alkaliphilum]|uniref:bifunctional serine/threonine-protein kinase/formylglycine-generating enzyme family protein n=1 Tax=Marinimicrobium alkaliphilum TaxID=2202654 RepID=UPI000DB92343|nr:bifunctional serine/threonine-protein kinase/formylglycine-generating enzyme family protein [Marinimicrobium alkaliphilum]